MLYTHVSQFLLTRSVNRAGAGAEAEEGNEDRPSLSSYRRWLRYFSRVVVSTGSSSTSSSSSAFPLALALYKFVVFTTSPSLDVLSCMLGCLGAGCVVVPLNTRWGVGEMLEAVRGLGGDGRVVAVVVDGGWVGVGRAVVDGLEGGERFVRVDVETKEEEEEIKEEEMKGWYQRCSKAAYDVAFVIFTSGTSSPKPKGAMLTHDNVVFQCRQKEVCCGYEAGDVYLHVAGLYHVGGLVSALAVVMVGGRHVFLDGYERFDAGEVVEVVAGRGVTSLIAVPTMVRDLVEVGGGRGGGRRLSSVRRVLVGAGGCGRRTCGGWCG